MSVSFFIRLEHFLEAHRERQSYFRLCFFYLFFFFFHFIPYNYHCACPWATVMVHAAAPSGPGEHILLQICSRGQTLRKNKFANTKLKRFQLCHWPCAVRTVHITENANVHQLPGQQQKNEGRKKNQVSMGSDWNLIEFLHSEGKRSDNGRLFLSPQGKVDWKKLFSTFTQRLISFSVVVSLCKLHHVHYFHCSERKLPVWLHPALQRNEWAVELAAI